MKHINILSLVQAYSSLSKDSYSNFLYHYDIETRDAEVDDLTSLVSILCDQTDNKNIFNQFYVGYKIPQIGKEFDLLRFGEKCIINIELKRTSTEEKVLKQLRRNKYYLGFLERSIYNFSFIADVKQLYCLNNKGDIEKSDFSYLVQLLEDQKNDKFDHIDNLFNPSDYLVSPFNATEKFIKNEYFLTHQQEEIKTKVLSIVIDDRAARFISITGGAGTGKTLLAYDIAKEIRQIKKKVLIIHCANLNSGHHKLNDRYSWDILPIKDVDIDKLFNYDVVIIDEAQRIRPNQLKKIAKKIQSTKRVCIFSYDKLQTLNKGMSRRKAIHDIESIGSIVVHKLSKKIRTNKEIASFIRLLFNKKASVTSSSNGNIELNYFNSLDDAKEFLESLNSEEWKILRLTPSRFDYEYHEKYSDISSETSHKIIGQEFDSVVVTIDEFFSYDKNGKLIYENNSYYDPPKMLFQNMTRTRKKLNIIIIDNSELLDRCISILKS